MEEGKRGWAVERSQGTSHSVITHSPEPGKGSADCAMQVPGGVRCGLEERLLMIVVHHGTP